MRHHILSPRTRNLVFAVVISSLLIGVGAGPARAQESSGPFVRLPKIIASDATAGDTFGSLVTIGGDVALVGSRSAAYVLERGGNGADADAWREVAKLAPPGGDQVSAVAVSKNTALVGGGGQVAVFQRNRGGRSAWGLVTTLVPDDATTRLDRIAISGDTAVIAQGTTDFFGFGPRSVRVLRRHHGGRNAWGEVARLTPPADDFLGQAFGISLAISGDTLIVGETWGPTLGGGRARVYERNRGGAEAWGLVTTLNALPGIVGFGFAETVSISGDTAVLTSGEFGTGVSIFERNLGGVENWGGVRGISAGCCEASAHISGNTLAVGATDRGDGGATIYSRNQGGADRWGQVAVLRIGDSTSVSPFGGFPVGVTTDTVLLGAFNNINPDEPTAVQIFVADVDGDGLRDAADPCPRDPLNNIAPRCRRSVAASQVVEDRVSVSDVETALQGRTVIVTETFTNTSDTAIRNPFLEVTFSGKALILNADGGGDQGSGATLSPDVGDGVLSPGEQMTVQIEVRPQGRRPVVLLIKARGDVEP